MSYFSYKLQHLNISLLSLANGGLVLISPNHILDHSATLTFFLNFHVYYEIISQIKQHGQNILTKAS